MNENQNLKPVQTIPPFTKMIMTIGALPTSFYSSMSYYEAMVWLYEYLKNTIIPTVNANGEAVIELQEKFIELKTWIDEYFDNLNVQEEINNKLDEMAEDGTLADIIAEYIKMQGQLVYNSIAEMKEAENIQEGSFLKTYGFYEYNDGGGALYKARAVTNEDIVDNMFIIALHDNTLVAELITDEYNVLQLGVNLESEDVTEKIQAIINKAYSIGGNIIYFPKGTYNIDQLTIPKDARGITLKGEFIESSGTYGTVFNGITSENDSIIKVIEGASSNPTTDMTIYLTIENIFLNGNDERKIGIELNECSQNRLSKLRIMGFTKHGIKLRTVFDSILEDIYFNNNGIIDENYAIYIDTSPYNTTNATRFINLDIEHNYGAFYFNNFNQILVSNCKIEDTTANAIDIASNGTITFSQCLFTPSGYNINENYFFKVTSVINQVTVNNCTSECASYGEEGAMLFDFSATKGGIISDCQLTGLNSLYYSIKLNEFQNLVSNNLQYTKKNNGTLSSIYCENKCLIKDNYFRCYGFTTGGIITANGILNKIIDNRFTDDFPTAYLYNLGNKRNTYTERSKEQAVSLSTTTLDAFEYNMFNCNNGQTISAITGGYSGQVLYISNVGVNDITLSASILQNSATDVTIESLGQRMLINKNGNWYLI